MEMTFTIEVEDRPGGGARIRVPNTKIGLSNQDARLAFVDLARDLLEIWEAHHRANLRFLWGVYATAHPEGEPPGGTDQLLRDIGVEWRGYWGNGVLDLVVYLGCTNLPDELPPWWELCDRNGHPIDVATKGE